MGDNAPLVYTKLPSDFEPRLSDNKEQSTPKKIVVKVFKEVKSPALSNAFKWPIYPTVAVVFVVGIVTFFYLGLWNISSKEPHHMLDRDMCLLITWMFCSAPLFVLFTNQGPYYNLRMIPAAWFLMPYSAIVLHVLSLANLATMETMRLLLGCAQSSAVIFLLPVYVLFIRNREIGDGIDNPFMRSSDKRRNPTWAEVTEHVTPCCVYYALVLVTSVAATSIAYFGKIEHAPFLQSLAFTSLISCSAFYPLHWSRKVSIRWWFTAYVLIIAPLAITAIFLLQAYEMISLDSMVAESPKYLGIFWVLLPGSALIRICTIEADTTTRRDITRDFVITIDESNATVVLIKISGPLTAEIAKQSL